MELVQEIKVQNKSQKSSGSKKVAVIGGGFSGLAAAYDLAKAGHDVTIYEYQKYLGGLAAGFDLGGYPIERAYHFLYQSDEDLLTFAEELGIRETISFHESRITYFHEGTHYPLTTPYDLLRFSPLNFFNRLRLGVLTLYLKKVTNWRKMSKITAYDWLNKYMGKQVTEEVWSALLKGKFNKYYDQITMSWLWGRFNLRTRSQNKDFSGEKLGYPEGGFELFVNEILKKLDQQGAKKCLNTGILSIERINDQIKLTTLKGESEFFDGVISTVPSPVFSDMIRTNKTVPQAYLDKLNSIDYLNAVIMVFRTKQELTDCFWYNIKDPRVTFLTLLSTSALAGKEQFGGSDVYYVGAYIPDEHHYMSDDFDIESEWKEGLKVMFPDFDETQIQELEISKFRNAQHIVDIGYEENKLVPFETPLEGVYLANFSQIYPDDRGINFAIRDGRSVAKELVMHFAK